MSFCFGTTKILFLWLKNSNNGGGDHVVARARDPNRIKALEMWKQSNNEMKLKEIAEQLGISEGTVRCWKNKD